MAGRRRALLLANAAYAEGSGYALLNAPPNDARSLEAILKDPGRGAFDDVARLDEPTRATMLRAAKETLTEAGPDDVVLMYYSGHGDVDLDGALYLVASDTEKGHLESTGVETETLSRMIQRAAVGRTVLILDCCHAGAFVIPGAKSGDDILQTRLDDYARGSGTYMLMATSARDVASDGPPGGLSVLTRHVVEGLGGAADEDRDGTISVRELSRYLDRQMARHETQRFLESGLNRQGDVLLAWSGIDREAELIPQIRAKLFDWRQQDAITSDVLAKALAILEAKVEVLDDVDGARRRLLFDLVEKETGLGQFLHWWYYARRRYGQDEDDGRTALQRLAPGPQDAKEVVHRRSPVAPTPAKARPQADPGRTSAPPRQTPTTSPQPAAETVRPKPGPADLARDIAIGVALAVVVVTLSRAWEVWSDNKVSTSESAFFLLLTAFVVTGALRGWVDGRPSWRRRAPLNDSTRVAAIVLTAFASFVAAGVAGIIAL